MGEVQVNMIFKQRLTTKRQKNPLKKPPSYYPGEVTFFLHIPKMIIWKGQNKKEK